MALLFLSAAWGGSFLFIRVAGPALGPAMLSLTRVTIAAALLLGMFALSRRKAVVPSSIGRILILGALNAALPYYLIARAELQLTASLAAMLGATQALWGVVIGVLFLGERVSIKAALGFLVGTGGVALLVGFSPKELNGHTLMSVGAVLIATLSYASASAYSKVKLADIAPTQLAFGQQIAAAVLLVGPATLQAHPVQVSLQAGAAALALASVSTAGAYIVYFKLIARIGPTRANLVTFLSPAFGVLWGRIFLNEVISAGGLLGFGLILTSLVLTTRSSARGYSPPNSSERSSSGQSEDGANPSLRANPQKHVNCSRKIENR